MRRNESKWMISRQRSTYKIVNARSLDEAILAGTTTLPKNCWKSMSHESCIKRCPRGNYDGPGPSTLNFRRMSSASVLTTK